MTQTLAADKKGQTVTDVKKLKVQAFMAMNRHRPTIPGELKPAVQKQLGDEEWLIATGLSAGVFTQADDGSITFE